jgi:prevent-host-death family protein
MMETVGSYRAKTHLPRLLERVQHGETVTITRHGKPIARLVPAEPTAAPPSVVEIIAAMKRFQEEEGPTLGTELAVRALINEGRR